jgi:hypothetical protein
VGTGVLMCVCVLKDGLSAMRFPERGQGITRGRISTAGAAAGALARQAEIL